MTSFLRFSRPEYQAIVSVCRTLNLERCTPNILRRVLVHSLGKPMAGLSGRIRDLSSQELRILHDHLREQQSCPVRTRFAASEFNLLVEAFGSLLFNLRFVRPLKRALVTHFKSAMPKLAAKLEAMTYPEFEELCQQVQQRVRRGR